MVLSMNTHVAGFVGKHPVSRQPSAGKFIHRLRWEKGAVSRFMNDDAKTKLTGTQNKDCDHPGKRIRPIGSQQKRAGDDQPIGENQLAGFKRTALRNPFELIAGDVIHERIIGASKSKAPHGHAAWLPNSVVTGTSELLHGSAGDGQAEAGLQRDERHLSLGGGV